VLAVWLTLSLAPAAAEYMIELTRLEAEATSHARSAAARLAAAVVEGRGLARTRSAVLESEVAELFLGHDVVAVRVLDEAGGIVPEYERHTADAWGNAYLTTSSASILVEGRQVGTVEVAVSRRGVLKSALMVLAAAIASSTLLGVLLYWMLARVISGTDVRIRDLIASLREANRDSEALRVEAERSARQLRDILQDVDAVVWAAELPSGRFLFVSERAEAVLGYPLTEWTADPTFWVSHLHPEDRDQARQVLEAAARGERHFEIEHRVIAADGRVVWLRNRIRVFRDPHGQARELRGVMVDVTERKEAETALRSSQEQYRSLVENVKQVIFQTDARGRWTILNSAWTELTGFRVEESLGKLFLDYVHVDDRRRHAEFFQPLMRGESRYLGQEVRYLTKAGHYRWVEVYSRLTVDTESRITGTAGTLTDITERRQGAEDLAAAQERLRHLLASSPAVIHSREAAGDFPVTFVSDNVGRLFGYDAQELCGDPRRWAGIIHPDDVASILGALALVEEDEEQSHEYRLRRKDGVYRWVRDEWRLIRDSSGKPIEVVGSLADVTESKQGEEERVRLGWAVEQSNEAVVITDPEAVIVYVNQAWERLTGYSRGEVVGQNVHILKTGQPDSDFYRGLWTTLDRGGPWHAQIVNQRKDRTQFEAETSIAPVRDAAGRVVNYVQLLRDVTRERQVEEQLRQSQKMDAIGRLAGGVAHDFNNLLTVMMGRCELLLTRLAGETRARADVELVLRTAQRATSLTRQLLAFSRKQVLAVTVLDLTGIVTGMEQMLRRLIGEDIELITSLAPRLGRVKADQGQIEQVVLNLAVNSRDAMPRGGRLTIETADVDAATGQLPSGAPPGPYVMLTVTDTGCGMDQATISRIFEPFFTTKEVDKGTGLGLSTVYGIVKQSGGEVLVDSEVGHWTRFRVYLPRVDDVATATRPAVRRPDVSRGSETVLLVEDEPEVRSLAYEILSMSGYTVLVAADGAEALRIGASHPSPIALVITDVIMPQMGGASLGHEMRALRPETRVLYMSGYTDDAVGRHGLLGGAPRLLQKPFTAETLTRTVRELLDEPASDAARRIEIAPHVGIGDGE
jgi:PAS domain S-box-containing protein